MLSCPPNTLRNILVTSRCPLVEAKANTQAFARDHCTSAIPILTVWNTRSAFACSQIEPKLSHLKVRAMGHQWE